MTFVMLEAHVILCLDVKEGRVVKDGRVVRGVNFVDLGTVEAMILDIQKFPVTIRPLNDC